MPFRVVFFTGESTIVPGDTEEEAIDHVWHWTSAKIEIIEEVGSISEGQPDEEGTEIREG